MPIRRVRKRTKLTPLAASQRAKKAWVTKHSRYKYGSFVHMMSDDPEFKGRRRPDEDLIREAIKQEELHGRSADDDPVAQEFHETGTVGKDFAEHLKGATKQEREEFTQMMSSLPANQRDKMIAQLLKQREQERLLPRKAAADKQRGSHHIPSKDDPVFADDAYTDTGKLNVETGRIRQSLHGPINQYPSEHGHRVRKSDENPDERTRTISKIEVTEEGLKAEARKRLKDALIVSDPRTIRSTPTWPATGRATMRGKLDLSKDLKGERGRHRDEITEQEKKDYEDAIVKSYLGGSEADRIAAKWRAERLASKISAKAARNFATAHKQGEVERADAKIRASTSSITEDALRTRRRTAGDISGEAILSSRTATREAYVQDKLIGLNTERANVQGEYIKRRDRGENKKNLRNLRKRRQHLDRQIADRKTQLENIRQDNARRNAAPITEIDMSKVTPRPREDRFRAAITAEDVYQRYGHETDGAFAHLNAKRDAHNRFEMAKKTATERRDRELAKTKSASRRKLIHNNYFKEVGQARAEFESTSLPPKFSRIRAQFDMNKRLTNNKIKAARSGKLSLGISKKGVVAPDDEDAFLRVSPNKQWRYELRDLESDDPNATKIQHLNYWDTKTEHKEGKRDQYGNLLPEQRDELVSEQLVDRFDNTVTYVGGKRIEKNATPLTDMEHDEIIIPIKGARRSVKHIKTQESETYEQRLLINRRTGQEWIPSTDQEWRLADKDPQIRRHTKQMPKKSRVVVVDPSELKLDRKQTNTVAIKLPHSRPRRYDAPGTRIGNLTAGSHRNQNFMDRVVEVSLPDNKLGELAAALPQAREERHLRQRSFEEPMQVQVSQARASLSKLQNERDALLNTPNSDVSMTPEQEAAYAHQESRLKEFIGAGTAAIYYGSQKRVRKGRIPNTINKGLDRLRASDSKAGQWAAEHLPNAALDVNEAYVRPGLETASTFGFQLRHPFTSASGTTGGLDLGTFYTRDAESKWARWIPIKGGEDEITARKIRQQKGELDRILIAQQYVEKHAYEQGARGKFTRWRSEPLIHHQDYKNLYTDTGKLAEAKRTARDTIFTAETGSAKHTAALELLARVKQEETRRSDVPSGFGSDIVPFMKPSGFHISAPSDFQRNALIGGAVVGTAVGAHYLYHRHQQSKLAEEDKSSYIESITPHKRSISVPTIRPTGRVRIGSNPFTREFNFEGKKVPVEWGVSMKEKTIWKGKPSERGYDKGASLGLSQLGSGRKGTEKGSLSESLFFDMSTGPKLRRSSTPAGGQLMIKGKKMPVTVNIGKKTKINLKSANPRRMTQEDRENVVWAFKGHRDEAEVRAFFGPNDKIHDLFDDADAYAKIQRKKQGSEEKSVFRKAIGVEADATDDPIRDKRFVTQDDLDWFNSKEYEKRFKQRGTAMSTGGTMGQEPYSQIGQKRTKYDEIFHEGRGYVWGERPVGSGRVTADDPFFEAMDPNSRDQSKLRSTKRKGKRKSGRKR